MSGEFNRTNSAVKLLASLIGAYSGSLGSQRPTDFGMAGSWVGWPKKTRKI